MSLKLFIYLTLLLSLVEASGTFEGFNVEDELNEKLFPRRRKHHSNEKSHHKREDGVTVNQGYPMNSNVLSASIAFQPQIQAQIQTKSHITQPSFQAQTYTIPTVKAQEATISLTGIVPQTQKQENFPAFWPVASNVEPTFIGANASPVTITSLSMTATSVMMTTQPNVLTSETVISAASVTATTSKNVLSPYDLSNPLNTNISMIYRLTPDHEDYLNAQQFCSNVPPGLHCYTTQECRDRCLSETLIGCPEAILMRCTDKYACSSASGSSSTLGGSNVRQYHTNLAVPNQAKCVPLQALLPTELINMNDTKNSTVELTYSGVPYLIKPQLCVGPLPRLPVCDSGSDTLNPAEEWQSKAMSTCAIY